MSQGLICDSTCHGRERENVRIVHHRHNHSAFSGYHWTASDYSQVVCLKCGTYWRTKAEWLWKTKMLKKGEHPHYPDMEACK